MNFIKKSNRIYSVNEEGKIVAEIDFEKKFGLDNTYVIFRTFVDKSLQGQGIAGLLVEEAIREIQGRGANFEAKCSFAKEYLEKKKNRQ
ncbi:MAG: N-acetyltransferase [Clostridiales bacterium]|nr:N-acetyltransferase [Clostridiales bacterium]